MISCYIAFVPQDAAAAEALRKQYASGGAVYCSAADKAVRESLKTIDGCDFFIAVLSRAAAESPLRDRLQLEISQARKRRLRRVAYLEADAWDAKDFSDFEIRPLDLDRLSLHAAPAAAFSSPPPMASGIGMAAAPAGFLGKFLGLFKKKQAAAKPSAPASAPAEPRPSALYSKQSAGPAMRPLAPSEQNVSYSFSFGSAPKPFAPQIDAVRQVSFSALSAARAQREEYQQLTILMYTEEQREQAERIRRELIDQPKETRSHAPVSVRQGQRVTVRLSSPDLELIEPELELPWQGDLLEFDFSYYVPETVSKKSVLITANVYFDQVAATRLQIILPVEQPEAELHLHRHDIRYAFMSYASENRQKVLSIVQGMHRARPDMSIFMDVESLRSGQDWEDMLKRKIKETDVLYLCWSQAAKTSKWVDFEWRYAFDLKGAQAIEPIPLEPPELCAPPDELRDKHFSDPDMLISFADQSIRDRM